MGSVKQWDLGVGSSTGSFLLTSSMSTGLLKMLKRLSVARRLVTSLRKSLSSRNVFSSCSARRRCSSTERTLGPGASATGSVSLHLSVVRESKKKFSKIFTFYWQTSSKNWIPCKRNLCVFAHSYETTHKGLSYNKITLANYAKINRHIADHPSQILSPTIFI